jgi:hypothetical protein
MSKNLKPLVITTKSAQSAGSEFIWNKLQNPEIFISSIVTQEVNTDHSEELNKLISGIPTPLARTAMFKYAINYVGQAGEDLTGLMAFYKTLQNEWKGLVACMALDNQPISVEKISLEYSDGKNISETSNLYEPKGSIGNMLFEDRSMWCDQQAQMDNSKKTFPYIYIVRYNGVVIGGTSPESFLFTAPVYHIHTNKGFYSSVTKKFTDPLSANLSREDVEKLYVYVKHINRSISAYIDQFTKKKPDVQKISVFLNNWLSEIRSYAGNKGYDIDENTIVPNLNKFKAPFDKLFNYQTTLYGYGGRISSDISTLHLPEGIEPIEVELAELLLDPDMCTVSEIIFDEITDAAASGINMLKAISDVGERYFTLPLSEKGLAIFQDEIEGLLTAGGDVRSSFSAIYDMSSRTLQVTLQVDVNGNITSFAKSYKEPVRIEGQKVICWPDFISRNWNKYYLYSEIPHNAPELKALPLRAGKDDFRLLVAREKDGTLKDGKYQFRKIAVNGKKTDEEDTADILVEYDMNKLGSTDLKYEIYESAEPFKGIEFQYKNKHSGYVIFKKVVSHPSNSLKDYRSLKTSLSPVRVGFDFGSNNTCISFAEIGSQPQLITFHNRRKFLLGVDIPNNSKVAASPNEVFFFQNEQTQSNQVKSMVMIHDERRIKNIEQDPKNTLSREIKGGFPVFEKNIPVDESAESTYTTRFANQPSYIKFNMKWSNDEKENAYKLGLLKVLYLKTYAELLDQEKYPESLVWAYPSSMNKQILLRYGVLWNEIGKINPLMPVSGSTGSRYAHAAVAQFAGSSHVAGGFGSAGSGSFGGIRSNPFSGSGSASGAINTDLDLKAQTEAAAVCKHALGVGFQAGQRGLIIGFDIGGSTTDMLCIATKKDKSSGNPDDFKDTLIKQSSIKFAAGKLADATKKSKKFQDVLKSFCRKKELYIHGITVAPERLNANTTTYYYNLIIDRLTTEEDLNEFYRNLAADCPELFTINAYMTGLIMFYAGQLAHKIRTTQEEHPADYLAPFEHVMVGCFGKGGRMFDWLRAMNETSAFSYYQSCFGAGYGVRAQDHISKFDIIPSDTKFVKAEVSFGLSSYKEINTTSEQIHELIGEEGFNYNGAPIEEFANVESKFMQHFGNQFSPPREFKRFSEFANIFYSFSHDFFGFNLPNMQQEINNMRLKSYIENIPEYILAKRGQEFDFEAPVIVLEGMCFLDTVLMEKLFGK